MAERKVELYVYDLSQGLARQMSMAFLGIQIDAVYHTSIVIGGREYYYGHGIQSSFPGQTHHGSPMEIVPLGTTELPDAVVREYIDSMRLEYTPESYDLFLHNCNNFTADLAMFLCGVGIPGKIKNLPQDVLNTPFGQMLRPALEQQLRPITTAHEEPAAPSKVRAVTSQTEFENIVKTAPCVVAFFTSASCPPCRMVYPHFGQLATETSDRGVFVKVDIGFAQDIAETYLISSTPTFMTWSRGEKLDEWVGASPSELKQKVDLLLRVTYPPHSHTNIPIPITLDLASRAARNPTVFSKIPPLDKVTTKLGPTIAETPAVKSLLSFLRHRASAGPANTPIPDQPQWAAFLQHAIDTLPPTTLFPLIDLFRAALADPRVSGWFAEEKDHTTIKSLLTHITTNSSAPYPLRLVTIQALSNLFTTPLFPPHLLARPLCPLLINAITTQLLDGEHPPLRGAAGVLALRAAGYIQQQRSTAGREVLGDDALVEFSVGLLEGVRRGGEVRAAAVALALSVYGVGKESEVGSVLAALEAGEVLRGIGEGGLGREVAAIVEAS